MKKIMNKKIIGIIVAVIILVAGGSFYAGTKYRRNSNFAPNGNFANMRGGLMRTRQAVGGVTAGSILSKDDKSITVKLANGGSKIVFFTPNTGVTKSAPSSASELKVNDNVFVNGSANADGSISAETISIR